MGEEPEGHQSELDALSKRIGEAKDRHQPKSSAPSRSAGLGIAMRIATELVAAVAVGTGLGIVLDTWLGTGPLFVLVCFLFGVAAGFVNVIRAAREMEAERLRGEDGKTD